MPNHYSDDQLRMAARLYYVDGLGQVEVAKIVKVSQAMVSRLLAAARNRGIVRISVEDYEPRNTLLEQKIMQQFGLVSAAVIKTVQHASPGEVRRTIGHFGASFVASLIPGNNIVAIAGGRTIRELVQNLPTEGTRNIKVIPAMGSIDATIAPVDAFEIGHLLANRLGGSFYTINTPAFLPDRITRDAFLGLPQINSVWKQLNQTDVALIGIGTLENSIFAERGIFGAADLEQLRHHGAVGEICGRFFNEHGQECISPWRDRVISISLEQLRSIGQVVCITAGTDRAAALAAAIRGRLFKALVIDEAGATALIEKGQAPPDSTPSKKEICNL
jgi:DNA-binding transcriptional regulator LsrR (DeoR family)